VALAGERYDAHDYLGDAVAAGASGLVVADAEAGTSILMSEPAAEKKAGLILVEDTLAALQQIASAQRRRMNIPVVAVTGSSGKTSTKQMLAAVLGARFQVAATRGNFNNHIGLPVSSLEAGPAHTAAVWEIGMNHRGEVAPLAAIARPDVAVVTNIGVAHIEHLGTREEICAEKGDLIAALTEGGVAIFPDADEFADSLEARAVGRVVRPGFGQGEVAARDVVVGAEGGMSFLLECNGETAQVRLPIPGRHMVSNALLAAAAGYVLGISVGEIAEALAMVELGQGRLAVRKQRGVCLIDDSYNANPESMSAALRTLGEQPCEGRRIAVLGAMAELGDCCEVEHRRIGEVVVEAGIDVLLTVGKEAARIGHGAENLRKAEYGVEQWNFDSHSACAEHLRRIVSKGDCVLFKGSRSARMEAVLDMYETPEGVC
jgi:UDP-N-acetylmuramoyl-tripeptide--D-alanyl-D-alanine ligase